MNKSATEAAYGAQMAGARGHIFTQQSPSCGLERVKVYQDNGRPSEAKGRGIYSAAFCARRPDLPVEQDGRLNAPILRENFIARAYAYAQWQQLLRDGLTRKTLLDFHSRYKYLLMATHPRQYQALGRLLGNLHQHDLQQLAPRYFSELMAALKKCATRRSHSNTLQHLSGYLKRALDSAERQEMQRLIEQYRNGVVPLAVPLTLLKHHLRRHPNSYLATQVYLQPIQKSSACVMPSEHG